MERFGVPEIGIMVAIVCFVLIMVIVNVIPFWFISKKAGYHPALGLLTLIPLAHLVYLYFLAFSEWPALRQGSSHRI